jgi:Fic family protein
MKLGETVEFEWNGRAASAWVPARLAEREAPLSINAIRATERALAALRRMEDVFGVAAEPIARLLLRSEGMASSAVEGLRVPIEQVLSVEAGAPATREPGWVAQNLAIVGAAIEKADHELDVETLHQWHRQLMAGSDLAESRHGAWRNSPGWIGGSSPLDAAYVPPPAPLIPGLMEDLLTYVNSAADDPITQAARSHAQFETIHPYGDGNGRLGRVLIGWVLRRRGSIQHLPPPISVFVARDTGGYLSGLYQFRQGDPIRWIEWFAGTTARAAESATELFVSVADLIERWRARVSRMRSDSAVHRVIELLPRQPVVSAGYVAAELGVSRRTSLTALETLEDAGVVTPFEMPATGPGRPARWWIALELIDLVRTWMA